MSKEAKQEAFAAYQSKGGISDQQLALLLASVEDLLDTMFAIGEHGYHMHGYFHLADSLRSISTARARDRKETKR